MTNFDYVNIYVIYCEELLKKDCMMFSVGSTVQTLHNRLKIHQNDSKNLNRNSSLYIKMREYGAENWEMDLLEVVKVPNTTRQIRDRAKCKHEQRWINKLTEQEGIRPKLNDKDAFMDVEKFKEHRRKYKQQYWKNMPLEQKQKYSEKKGQYYEDHKEDIKARVNEYRLENRDEINRKKRESYHKNSTAINQKLRDKHAEDKANGTFHCEECGNVFVSKHIKDRHFKDQHGPNFSQMKEKCSTNFKEWGKKIVEYKGVKMTNKEKRNQVRREKRALNKSILP